MKTTEFCALWCTDETRSSLLPRDFFSLCVIGGGGTAYVNR